jgi:GNAT superfamily N-acetyltransferase
VTAALRVAPLDPGGDPGLAARLHAVQVAAYRVEAALIGDDRFPPLHETVDDVRAAPVTWLGAFSGNELVGAVAWTVGSEGWDIDRLAVDPVHHRRGIGSALVAAVLERAGGAQVTASTGSGNTPARALFAEHGFRSAGDIEVVPTLWVSQYVRPAGA